MILPIALIPSGIETSGENTGFPSPRDQVVALLACSLNKCANDMHPMPLASNVAVKIAGEKCGDDGDLHVASRIPG